MLAHCHPTASTKMDSSHQDGTTSTDAAKSPLLTSAAADSILGIAPTTLTCRYHALPTSPGENNVE